MATTKAICPRCQHRGRERVITPGGRSTVLPYCCPCRQARERLFRKAYGADWEQAMARPPRPPRRRRPSRPVQTDRRLRVADTSAPSPMPTWSGWAIDRRCSSMTAGLDVDAYLRLTYRPYRMRSDVRALGPK